MNAEKRGKMTVAQMAKYIGQQGFISCDGMLFEVLVVDVRQSWGDVHVLVVPSNGAEKLGTAYYVQCDPPTHVADRGESWKSVSSVMGLEVK